MATQLYTSLAQIRSFNPCASGWKTICAAHPHQTDEDLCKPIRLVDCLNSNSFADVCWLLGKRKTEIVIAVRAAKLCADSVAHLKKNASDAAAHATSADAYAAAYAANYAYAAAYADAYAAYVAAAAAYAYAETTYAARAYTATATAAAAAHATYADAAARADAAAYAAYNTQLEKNKNFLRQAILEYENGEL